MSIRHLLVNYDQDSTIERIECSDIRAVNSSIEELYIYNPNVTEPLHKFWYMLDSAKLEKKSSGGRSARIVISSQNDNLIKSLSALNDKVNSLIETFTKTDKSKRNKITYDYDQMKISDLITLSEYYPPTLDVNLDNQSTAFDSSGQKIDFITIGNGSKIKVLIELDRIVFKKEYVQKIWRVIQVKKVEKYVTTEDLFAMAKMDERTYGETKYNNNAPPPPPPPHLIMSANAPTNNRITLADITNVRLSKTSQNSYQRAEPKSTQSKGFQPPTQDQLLHMISKMKSKDKPKDKPKDKEEVVGEINKEFDEEFSEVLSEESTEYDDEDDEDDDEDDEYESGPDFGNTDNGSDSDSNDPFSDRYVKNALRTQKNKMTDSDSDEEDPFAPSHIPQKSKKGKTKSKSKTLKVASKQKIKNKTNRKNRK
jgi:Family of unknown function (DUF5871)